jgi:hypothetical protein
MKTKNKMMGILLIISALTAGLIPVYAATNQLTAKETPNRVQLKPTATNTIREVKPVIIQDLSDLDESTIDKKISEAENAAEIEEEAERAPPLWYLNAYGVTIPKDPVTDAAQTRSRIRLQLIAEKYRNTEFGVLYKVHWGRVTHMGEQNTVEGYALLDSDGVFYMKLDGEIAFKSIGRIHPYWFGVRVSMKGYVLDDDITYCHNMRGWAIPLDLRLIARLRNHLQ